MLAERSGTAPTSTYCWTDSLADHTQLLSHELLSEEAVLPLCPPLSHFVPLPTLLNPA